MGISRLLTWRGGLPLSVRPGPAFKLLAAYAKCAERSGSVEVFHSGVTEAEQDYTKALGEKYPTTFAEESSTEASENGEAEQVSAEDVESSKKAAKLIEQEIENGFKNFWVAFFPHWLP